MINLFNIPDHIIDTSKFSHILHDPLVTEFEEEIAKYVGAKYAVATNSATNALQICLEQETFNDPTCVDIPVMIPPVVVNAIHASGNTYKFIDDPNWIGNDYVFKRFDNFKIIDSAQRLDRNQYKNDANNNDLMIFSFYPTKPVSGIDGGIIVSNSKEKIDKLRIKIYNGFDRKSTNSWENQWLEHGYKAYMSSVQAYVCLNSFKFYESKLERLQYIKNVYKSRLNDVCEIDSNHLFRIYVDDNKQFIKNMKEKGIICGHHYPCLVSGEDLYDFPISYFVADHTVSLPFHEGLTDRELDIIITNASKYQNIY